MPMAFDLGKAKKKNVSKPSRVTGGQWARSPGNNFRGSIADLGVNRIWEWLPCACGDLHGVCVGGGAAIRDDLTIHMKLVKSIEVAWNEITKYPTIWLLNQLLSFQVTSVNFPHPSWLKLNKLTVLSYHPPPRPALSSPKWVSVLKK